MQKNYRLLLSVATVVALFDSCEPKNKKGIKESLSLGLELEDKVKISHIPPAEVPFGGNEVPAAADLSDKMPEPGQQGGQQSCVAWAIAYAMKSYQENVDVGKKLMFSPAFVYNQINNGRNVPTKVTDGLNILSSQGTCLMEEMPYNENEWEAQPSTAVKKSARRFRIDEWRRVNPVDLKEVKTYIATGSPVVIGAMIDEGFQTDGMTERENYIWKEKGASIGGHAMLVVGYDDDKNAFKIINSWGKNWGDDGYGWIDYGLFPEVVAYGFVAKDSRTDPTTLNDVNTNDPNDNDLADNNDNNPKDDHAELQNDDPTKPNKDVVFNAGNVLYNVKNPDTKHTGDAMKIEGTLDIPANYGKTFYVLVTVYDKKTDKPVKTLIYPDYSNVNHEVAGYTDPIPLDAERWRGKWWLHIPYAAMDLPTGRHDLYFIPTLFIDNFGVANGERTDFWFEH